MSFKPPPSYLNPDPHAVAIVGELGKHGWMKRSAVADTRD